MENRERITKLLHWKSFMFIGQDKAIFEGTLTQESEEAIVDIILKEIGYTRLPEPNLDRVEVVARCIYEETANELADFIDGYKVDVRKPRLWKEKPDKEYWYAKAREILKLCQPEPPVDKVEAIAVILGEDKYRDSFYGDYVTENDREHCRKVAHEIIKLFPEYEPVELKALSDEEIIAEYESWTNLDYDNEYQMKGLKGISQATIQHNQAKGQLYRKKEGKDDRPITENR